MSQVAIVTDSTAIIPDELTAGLPIYSAPLQVIWDGVTYQDGIDIQPEAFYARLESAKTSPTTSQVTPAAFNALYSRLIDEGKQILSIHISGALSGTLDSAVQAKELFPGARIELFDSRTTAMAMGFQVLEVARAAAQGATLAECVALAERARDSSGVMFVLSTLEYLRRGGRIGGAAAFVGTALNLKPILEVRGGRVEAVERVRTQAKAVDRLLDLFEQRVGGRTPVHIAALHANAEAEGLALLERARQRYGTADVFETAMTTVSPVLGTHTGPRCLGLAYLAGM